MNYNNFFSRISIKIALIVSILCLSLLSLLDYFVIKGSQETFNDVVSNVHLEPKNITLIDQSGKSYNIVGFNPDGTRRAIPLDQKFIDEFQDSLVLVSLVGLIASFLFGYIASRVITNPLNEITDGMAKLRENNYKLNLKKTDTYEIDNVIDEFNLLTKELQKVEELRKDLISDTSHELKTPLASLSGQLHGIKDGVLKPSKERIDELLNQVGRLDDLVEKLQEFSRLRSKVNNLNKTDIKFDDFIKNIVAGYDKILKEKEIKVNYNIAEDYKLNADKDMLTRVFNNFIENALNYSKTKDLEISANETEIKFKDSGVGIPEKDLPYIFERFYRVEKSRNRNTGGLGLGLAIVKEIIDAHGWKVKAKNGSGLTFVIKLYIKD